jgi:hypothetical protein
MNWKEQDERKPQVKRILNFSVAISKKNLAHVVLVTSDYLLVNWLGGSKFYSFTI